jgi:branched-chain amino acid transport system substrate-binding protein
VPVHTVRHASEQRNPASRRRFISRRPALVATAVATALTLLAACTTQSNEGSGSGSSGSSPSSSASSPSNGASLASSAPLSSGSTGGRLIFESVAVIDPDGNVLPTRDPGSVATPQGDGSATCPAGTALAVVGSFTGEQAVIGTPFRDAATLAVDQFTAANPGCQLTVKEFDTQGERPAAALGQQIVADPTILGVVGPGFSDETAAVGDMLNQAGLLSATPAATRPDLTQKGWTNFFRGLGTDADRPTVAGNYLAGGRGFTKVCVVSLSFPEMIEEARLVTEALGTAADPGCSGTAAGDFASAVDSIKTADPQGVFFSAGMPPAAELFGKLRDAGVTAIYMVSEYAYPPEFLTEVGAAGVGALLVCTCQIPTKEFGADFQDAFGTAPGLFAVEGYELATIAISGIASGAVVDRRSMIEYFRGYSGYGVAQQYQWDSTGELITPTLTVSEIVQGG